MLTDTKHRRRRFHLSAGAILTAVVILWAVPAWSLGIDAQADRGEVRIGESVVITVVGARSDADGDPNFVGAGVQATPFWRRGGQSAQSAHLEGDQWVKSWKFELVAALPGTTQVTPVIYLGADPAFGRQADSVLGAPIALVILPLPQPLLWPWFLGAAMVAVGTFYFVSRSLRKRREASYKRPALPPLEEALDMLDGARANRRADRARQYLGDIERVMHGYLTRKLGETLSGQTAVEIAEAVGKRVSDTQCVDELRDLLRQCTASKFGGARIEFETLAGLEEQVRRVLEQLDRSWV